MAEESGTPTQGGKPKACKVARCDGKYSAKGFCGKHYQQWKAGKLAASGVERKIGPAARAARGRRVTVHRTRAVVWAPEVTVRLRQLSLGTAHRLLEAVAKGKTFEELVVEALERWREE